MLVDDEHDSLVVMHHVAASRIEFWDSQEAAQQRLSRYFNRCHRGSAPRIDVQLEQAWRCVDGSATCEAPGG